MGIRIDDMSDGNEEARKRKMAAHRRQVPITLPLCVLLFCFSPCFSSLHRRENVMSHTTGILTFTQFVVI